MMALVILLVVIVPTLALKLTIDNLSPREGDTVTITCTIPSFKSSVLAASITNVNDSKTWGTCSSDGKCHTFIAANFSTNDTAMIMKKKVELADGGLLLMCTHDGDKDDLILPLVDIPPFHDHGLLIGLAVANLVILVVCVCVVICSIIYCYKNKMWRFSSLYQGRNPDIELEQEQGRPEQRGQDIQQMASLARPEEGVLENE